jgi:hypothetical protein
MAQRKFLILKRPRSGCLEGRTSVIQPMRSHASARGDGNTSRVFHIVEYHLAEAERKLLDVISG